MATSPETLGLLAAVEFYREFGEPRAASVAKKAADWIKTHAVCLDNNEYAIPYSPYNTKKIMVDNGTSFSCGALGAYIETLEPENTQLIAIYHGMIKYLSSALVSEGELGYWYYYNKERADLDTVSKQKADFYHQMQQVEAHSYAQNSIPHVLQKDFIAKASRYVLKLCKDKKYPPYTNSDRFFNGNVHVWGLVSVVSGFINYFRISGEEIYFEKAQEILKNLIADSWNGEYFYPILNSDGHSIVMRDYMVRSDAWVFNSLSEYLTVCDDSQIEAITTDCYQKMKSVDFSGPESHASTSWTRGISSLISILKPN